MTVAETVEHPYFTLGLAGIAILGIVLAILFYIKSRRYKLPLYVIVSRNVIKNQTPLIPGLSVHFKGQEQNLVTVSHVWFWNQGNETINASDIVGAKPLAIHIAEGVDLLDVQIVKVVDNANGCKMGLPVKQNDGSVLIPIQFDYLDKEDGLVVQIVHNGDAAHKMKVSGKIKGVEIITKAADAHAFHADTSARMTMIMKALDRPNIYGAYAFLPLPDSGFFYLLKLLVVVLSRFYGYQLPYAFSWL